MQYIPGEKKYNKSAFLTGRTYLSSLFWTGQKQILVVNMKILFYGFIDKHII